MSNFGEVREKIRTDIKVQSTGLSDAIIEDCILRAIRSYYTTQFWFNVKKTDIAIVEDDEYLDLPSDFVIPLKYSLTYSNYKTVLQPTTLEYIEDNYSESTSIPEYYAIFGSQIRLYPISDDSYTSTLFYVYELTELSGDSAENEWLIGGEELIKATAKKYIYAEHLFNKDMTMVMAALEAEHLTRMNSRTFLHTSNRKIRGSGW